MTRHLWFLALGFALAFGVAAACGSGGAGPRLTNTEACETIIEHCHPKDDGTNPAINGCHTQAHDGGDCLSDYDACIAACDAAPAVGGGDGDDGTGGTGTTGDDEGPSATSRALTSGADDDSSGGTSGGDGGSTGATGDGTTGGEVGACEIHCACMVDHCTRVPGYPYANAAACVTHCESFTAEETACFPMWCEEIASLPNLADHLCEHAWGEFGLDEC